MLSELRGAGQSASKHQALTRNVPFHARMYGQINVCADVFCVDACMHSCMHVWRS